MSGLTGRSGLTYQQWLANRAADLLAGRADKMPGYLDFLREFIADDDGCVTIQSFVDPVAKTEVMLDKPMRVLVEDLPRIEAGILVQTAPGVEFTFGVQHKERQ